ncbi:MAG: IS1182 family transposase, partial [Verrucomicrobia bacterium]|nr:IS1182 family transposase [Verrucomicrobiota bacterium]
MQYIQGKNRTQCLLFPQSLDEIISADNDVRFIDLFAESINIADFMFVTKQSLEGRPAYHPKDLLKLFIYGYLNSIRSSRALEKQCHINIEVRWLMKELAPDHNTIANFRRDNSKAIRKVFQHTVSIAKNFDLIGGKLIAGDSTKLRAQNSKKNNFNEKKIIQHIEYIDKKLAEYNTALSQADEDPSAGQADNKKIILQEIEKQQQRRDGYEKLSQQIMDTDDTQVSVSDPDSRQMITRNNITEVAYNVQTTVDEKHSITLDYKVTNTNDSKAMSGMLRRAKTILHTHEFTALYDKGYHTGSELKYAVETGIEVMVAVPGVAAFAPDENYNFDKFIYDQVHDCYTCPEGNSLHTNGNWYQKSKERAVYFVKHYKTNKCQSCPALALCTKNKKGRLIERSEYQPYVDKNKQNIQANPSIYKLRQQIIEHTYGIIKRQWGFYYISTKKGIKRASADVGLIFTALNLRRIINLLNKNDLKAFLKELCFLFFPLTRHLKT